MMRLRGKRNNKGSSLVVVIIAMGFISVLAASALVLGVMGYQMKVVEAGAKENLYSTETVLNQICSGLQEVAENKMEEAYTYTLTRYSATPEEKRKEFTKEKYVDFMEIFLKEKAGASETATYSSSDNGTVETLKLTAAQREALLGWLEDIKAYDEASFVVNNDVGNIVFRRGAGEKAEDYSVTLTDITLGYTGEGYTTNVTTDIKLASSETEFGQGSGSASASSLSAYGVIADGVVESQTTSNIYGSVYAGQKLRASAGSNLKIEAEKVLSRGTIETEGGASLSIAGSKADEKCQVWADNIRTTGAKRQEGEPTGPPVKQLSIDGICNIANDLTMNNPIGNVDLKGEYYGYGLIEGMKSVSYGSSIAVNTPMAKLDLSGLEKLHLAGRAAISVESTDSVGAVNSVTPVMMGESLSYMWSQNAYLLPGDCLPGIGHNPMTLEEYETVFKQLTGADKFNITRYIPVALRKYINPTNPYTEIFVKHSIGEADTGIMVYLYMNFMTPNYASTYFQEYAETTFQKNELEAVATILGFQGTILNEHISSSDGGDERLQAAGNIIDYQPGALTEDGYIDKLGEMSVSGGAMYTSNVFSNTAINKTYARNGLVSYLDEDKKIANPTTELVSNLVNIDMLKTSPLEEEHIVAKKGDVRITKPFTGVIIADGNVTINAKVTGLVLATGSITVNDATVEADPNIFTFLLNEGIDAQKYFKPDLGNTEGSTKANKAEDETQKYDRIVISFENWRKA